MIVTEKLKNELTKLNKELKKFGKDKCKHRCKEAEGRCDFFADAGQSFYMPSICSIENCPRLTEAVC